MANHEAVDQDLRCAGCGDGFIFTTGEQELFRLRGVTTQPSHCPSCVRRHGPLKQRQVSPDLSFG